MHVLLSLTQLIGTMHNICKVRGSNPDHQKKILYTSFSVQFNILHFSFKHNSKYTDTTSSHCKILLILIEECIRSDINGVKIVEFS